MTTVWEDEYRSFRKRNLGDKDFVYVWADGVHFNVQSVHPGVRQDGTKERGWRESGKLVFDAQSARHVLAVGDGALGFWGALRDVWPQTQEQRDWFHKLGNKLPKRLQPKAKRMLRDIMWAESKQQAEEEVKAFKA